MPSIKGTPLTAGTSVLQDWRLPLPPDKSITYLHTLRLLETSYSIFSVNLDEAIGLHRCGHLNRAYSALSLAPSLCHRLGGNVQILLRAMLAHAKHFRITPSVSPLDPDNFQLAANRRAASFSSLCCRVILSRRSQFVHKITTLIDLVTDLEKVFSGAVSDLQDSSTTMPDQAWDALDSSHYDLNTCLRESVVLMKCFLHALPAEQLSEFALSLQEQPVSSLPRALTAKRHLAHRRIALLKGQ